jgi:hypothetical protein
MGTDDQGIPAACHSERSEESRMMLAFGRADGFFAALRMTPVVVYPF